MAKRSFAIFYIDANKGYFYGSNAVSALQVEIPLDTMSYFDVVNKEKFYQLIQALVTTNKIDPVPVLILISPFASYEKDSATKLPEDTSVDIQQFLESVPFEKVLNRTYKVGDGKKTVATNKELYEVIKRGFEKVHFSVVAVVSFSLLQKMIPDIGTTLNLENVASRFDAIKQYSFISGDDLINANKIAGKEQESTKPNPLRLYGLIGVFVALIAVLIFMVMTTLQPTPPPVVKKAAAPVLIPTSTIAPTVPENREGTASGQILSPTPHITSVNKETLK